MSVDVLQDKIRLMKNPTVAGLDARIEYVPEYIRKAAFEQYRKRIPTGVLNEALADAQASLQPPISAGRRLKIYYATQQSVCPPTFVFFINDEELMHFAYERYLENQFRKSFGFVGTPIRFILREKQKDN